MKVAVVGGGIVGLFAAWYLEREGADVTLFEEGALGKGSVHAAGIIEPATAYRTNTFSFLRRVRRYLRNGTCTIRGFDAGWLVESARQLERPPPPGADDAMRELSSRSVAEYRALAQERNDFDYAESGLVQRFDDPRHFAEERDLALSRRSTIPVEVREEGRAGSLFFPDAGWLHTERFAERMARELDKTRVLHQRVRRVELDGTVVSDHETAHFDAVAVCAGVACRKLGVPLTGVRGYGWHAESHDKVGVATIFVDSGIAAVPFADEVKVTGGWDFDLSDRLAHASTVLEAVRRVVAVDAILDFKDGSRPCTPDGLPTVGRKERLVVATGGFRLGWSFAPGLGRHAARLALGSDGNDPFLARYCGTLHAGDLG
jgi:glycine/D-amino acid oxidase-like deaminating enzyme